MKIITLRPAELKRDFGQIAALLSHEQDEPTSTPALKEDYEAHKERIFRLMVAEDEQGELLGLIGARAAGLMPAGIFLPDRATRAAPARVGRQLYDDLEQAAKKAGIKQLTIDIRDHCPEGRTFAERRGFVEQSHSIGLALDLNAFDYSLMTGSWQS